MVVSSTPVNTLKRVGTVVGSNSLQWFGSMGTHTRPGKGKGLMTEDALCKYFCSGIAKSHSCLIWNKIPLFVETRCELLIENICFLLNSELWDIVWFTKIVRKHAYTPIKLKTYKIWSIRHKLIKYCKTFCEWWLHSLIGN